MYEFSGKLKVTALALMIIGALGIGFGFFNGASKTIDDAKEAIEHHEAEVARKAEEAKLQPQYGRKSHADANNEHATHETHGSHEAKDVDHHAKHVLSQMHNRPWAAFFTGLFFLFMISLVIFAFYVIQIAASAGWSIVLFRLMEALSAGIIPLGIILFLFLLASAFGMNHIYPWMHAEGDAILDGKSWWLNIPGWLIRSFVYIGGYIFFRFMIIKKNREQDDATDKVAHEKAFKFSIFFLAFFMITESTLSWDWIMSLDPHWFSTLFGWYIFSTSIVSAITVIALAVMYLKMKGYLEFVNDSHLHDLGKYMFGFSIFWAYLWFAQYMLIWYSNMPEETTYFMQRMQQYKFLFFFMVGLNLVFPLLVLMDSDVKRRFGIMFTVGIVILIGHYIDVFVMIMPSTVGSSWHFGIPEIGSILFFVGLFIFCGFKALSKRPLLPKGNPFLKESKHYHY
jgi:hypothetical protein